MSDPNLILKRKVRICNIIRVALTAFWVVFFPFALSAENREHTLWVVLLVTSLGLFFLLVSWIGSRPFRKARDAEYVKDMMRRRTYHLPSCVGAGILVAGIFVSVCWIIFFENFMALGAGLSAICMGFVFWERSWLLR